MLCIHGKLLIVIDVIDGNRWCIIDKGGKVAVTELKLGHQKEIVLINKFNMYV